MSGTTTAGASLTRVPATPGSGATTASITVGFSLDANNNPVFSFSPASIEMAYGTDTITFTLSTTTGFVFDNYFAPATAPSATFTWSLDATKTVLTVTDTNSDTTTEAVHINYSVAVVNPTTNARYVSDPEIINDPEV